MSTADRRGAVRSADVDVEETRRRFLLAREQAAAGSSLEQYRRARAMRRWLTARTCPRVDSPAMS